MSTFPPQWMRNVETTAERMTCAQVQAKFRDELYPRQRELESTPHTKAESIGEFFRMLFWEQVKKRVKCGEGCKCKEAKR